MRSLQPASFPPLPALVGCVARLCCVVALMTAPALADDIRSLPEIEVDASRYSLLGAADAASEGVAGPAQIRSRITARPGELLEVVPGLIVSQHSGEGKANQYFLRGFNLDHGLDIKITLDGMPVNQRSHAHGQGWADLNPLIPELVSALHYRKGPFYVGDGDFANAGSVAIYTSESLDRGIASVGLGQLGHARVLLADTPAVGQGRYLYALELSHADGPWTHPDNYRKFNGVLRYSEGTQANGFSVTAMAYDGQWNATDQIPWRQYRQGLIGRYDTLDPSSGATASRYSISGEWRSSDASARRLLQAYMIRHQLDLYSNFNYASDSQFNQRDERVTSGVNLSQTWRVDGLGDEATIALGVQLQNDNIFNALRSTTARVLNTSCRIPGGGCRQDHITQGSFGLYTENHVHWTAWFRSVAGLRSDAARFGNRGLSDAMNSGTRSQWIISPKLSLVFGPWSGTEVYLSAGQGFHSNDARGVTTRYGERADGLVRTFGQEIGVRTEAWSGWQSTLALFRLDSDSEIVYQGDVGRTEDSGRRSRRIGIEFNNYWKASRWLTIDADLAYARARFLDPGGEGSYIEGAVEGVASIAAVMDGGGPVTGALQLRYFGPRPLKEDNEVRSQATATLSGRIGYRFSPDSTLELLAFNLLDSRQSAIDYYHPSYTFLDSAPQSGRVFHPVEPRHVRLQLVTRY